MRGWSPLTRQHEAAGIILAKDQWHPPKGGYLGGQEQGSRVIDDLIQSDVAVVTVVDDALVLSMRRGGRIAALAATSRLPAMYRWRGFVNARGLMSYGPSFRDTDGECLLKRRCTASLLRRLHGRCTCPIDFLHV